MKRFIFGTALTMLVMFTACEVIQPQEEQLPEDVVVSGSGVLSTKPETVVFTATIGADTRTNLQWSEYSQSYKTVWEEDDFIFVMGDSGEWVQCDISDGVGTTTATFKGEMLQSDRYAALYGTGGWGDYDSPGVYLFAYQWMESNTYGETTFGRTVSPMVARSNSTSFEFQNLCSVLKVSMTGNGESLNKITFRPNDSGRATCGSAQIGYLDDGTPYFTDIYRESDCLEVSAWGTLTSEPHDCYIVLPPGQYPGGFELVIETDQGSMTVSTTDDLVLERSKVHTVNVAYETETLNEQAWQLEVTEDDGTSWYGGQMQYEDGMFVMHDWYFDTGMQFRFRENNSEVWYGCPGTFTKGSGKTNTRVDLASGEGWWWFLVDDPGNYDIYIDPVEMCVYIMSDGITPYDIPTRENVLYDNYYTLYNNAVSGQYVKMYGAVLAKCGYGFILAIDGYRSNSIYVYDKAGLCDVELGNWIDIYATLAYYRYLPELVVNEGEYWMYVTDDTYYDYEPEAPYVITDPSSFTSSEYTYIRYVGTLNIAGSYHNIVFDGNTEFKGSITAPLQDLTQFDGKRVVVEGYYAGSNTSGGVTYINTIMKRIYLMEENGSSTEDIIPGESFPVTRPRTGFGGQTSVMGSPSPVMRELSYQFYPER